MSSVVRVPGGRSRYYGIIWGPLVRINNDSMERENWLCEKYEKMKPRTERKDFSPLFFSYIPASSLIIYVAQKNSIIAYH